MGRRAQRSRVNVAAGNACSLQLIGSGTPSVELPVLRAGAGQEPARHLLVCRAARGEGVAHGGIHLVLLRAD